MTREDTFLQAIREHPEDDLARLAYADWLEERDDPRGRYLRAEVELCRLTEADESYAALEEVLQALRGDIEPEWVALAGKRYDVLLQSYQPIKKISIIKLIRELTGCGLKEAKDLSEAPKPVPIMSGLSRQEAERVREHMSYVRGARIAEIAIIVSGTPPLPASPSGTVDVYLSSYPPALKIQVIKVIRELTGLGLMEAKDLSERPLPTLLLPGVSPKRAAHVQAHFAEGVVLELRIATGQLATPTAAAPTVPLVGERFELVLCSYPAHHKINVIKGIREVAGLGLRESKDMAEGRLPITVHPSLTLAAAVAAKQAFADVAEIELRALPR